MRRVLSLLLSSAVLLLSGCGSVDSETGSTSPHVLAPKTAKPSLPRLNPRPFLNAFLRYEVGDTGRNLRRALQRTTAKDFAAELLAAPPGAPATAAPACIVHLRTTYLSRSPPRALAAGTAIRAGRPEPFAFLFEARHGRWLAAGPAE